MNARFQIDLNDPEISAHFPGKPILAAYKQVGLIESMLKEQLVGVKDVKFKSQITPPCEVEICIVDNKFEIKVGGEIKTTGKVILR